MDRLWTPWRYQYISGTPGDGRKGVPHELAAWPGQDHHCVFCNLHAAVQWGAQALGAEAADKAGLVIAHFRSGFVCLNRFPYGSGHLLVVPFLHTASLAELPEADAEEIMRICQRAERCLRKVYHPHGLNLGMNLGEAAGAGIAEHIHMHALPRWSGDTNFMTAIGDTRVLPEELATTWARVREAF